MGGSGRTPWGGGIDLEKKPGPQVIRLLHKKNIMDKQYGNHRQEPVR